MKRSHPKVRVEEDNIVVQDANVWTSAGATACIDLGLAPVEEDCGADVAQFVAKRMVAYHRRMGGQSQHSTLLALTPRTGRIQKALAYAKRHLANELSVEEPAEAAHLSPRQFGRVFREETGQTPQVVRRASRTPARHA